MNIISLTVNIIWTCLEFILRKLLTKCSYDSWETSGWRKIKDELSLGGGVINIIKLRCVNIDGWWWEVIPITDMMLAMRCIVVHGYYCLRVNVKKNILWIKGALNSEVIDRIEYIVIRKTEILRVFVQEQFQSAMRMKETSVDSQV